MFLSGIWYLVTVAWPNFGKQIPNGSSQQILVLRTYTPLFGICIWKP